MSVSVFSHNANVGVDVRLYRLNDKRAAEMVATGQGEFITVDGRTAIRKLPPQEALAERSATNQVLRHAKGGPIGALIRSPRLHYPVPACADHRRRWRARFMTGQKALDAKV